MNTVTTTTTMPINDGAPTSTSRHHRRQHSRHHSVGTMSLHSLQDDESEEPQQPPAGLNRKASLREIPYSLADWIMNNDDSMYGFENEADEEQDDRRDARDRLLSDDSGTGRERLLSEDGNTYELYSLATPTLDISTTRQEQQQDDPLSQDIGFEVELYEQPRVIPCFRGLVSCPEMPRPENECILQDDSERFGPFLQRTRAFTEDTGDFHRRASMDMSTTSISTTGNNRVRVRSYSRDDSMRIDSKYGGDNTELLTESPTSTYLFWEEHLNNPHPSSPYAEAFRN